MNKLKQLSKEASIRENGIQPQSRQYVLYSCLYKKCNTAKELIERHLGINTVW